MKEHILTGLLIGVVISLAIVQKSESHGVFDIFFVALGGLIGMLLGLLTISIKDGK